MRALQTAATGMMAQELNVQVISNNIANLRTTGYKRQQAHFQDLLYENFPRAGSFDLDAQGQLVTRDGYLVDPGITVPQEATAVTITAGGEVQATLPGQ